MYDDPNLLGARPLPHCQQSRVCGEAAFMASADKLIVEVPKSAADFRLPPGVSRRLQTLLDKQDRGVALTRSEREEAEGLVALVDWLALIRVRTPSEG